MKPTKLYLVVGLLVSFIAHDILFAQEPKVIQARLIDSKTGAAVPFATVRIMNGKTLIGGIVSNGDGGFQIPLRYHSSMNSIFITCIGYANLQMRMSELQEGKINIIKLKESSTQLKEVVVTSKRGGGLSANKIVRLAVANMSKNYPTHAFSYLAYYRDYQKEEKDYVNLNEALVGVYDQGFQSNDLASTKIKLYQYRTNKNFRTDSLTAIAYDNNNSGGNKFIPTATISSFGGNELSILRIHDALRNNKEPSFSFVNVFATDFVRNHKFELLKTVYLDEKPLYHISFESLYFVSKGTHSAKGEIFIEPETFAIHKLIYSTYLREYHEEKLLYKIQIEYARTNSRMYLNYISFNNFFKSKSSDGLLVTDVVYDRAINAFVVTFNHPPLRSSATEKSNYDFRFDSAPMLIGDVEVIEKNNNQVKIHITNARDFNLGLKPEELKRRFSADFKGIQDAAGNMVNEIKYKQVSQFRELFIQKLDTVSSGEWQGVFVVKNSPLINSPVDTTELTNASQYWMNSPLHNNIDLETKEAAADSLTQMLPERPLSKKPYELISSSEHNISNLEEKVYLQTDKPYYYPRQKIWYKAYMNYKVPFWRDSLSKVLYIELIDPQGKLVLSRTARIENGIAFGDIGLPPDLPPANYFLRAYTNWMCNFGEKDFFIKPIPVFHLDEQPEGNPMDTTRGPLSAGLTLSTSKTTYKPREEARLDIDLIDQHGNPLGANLSVSVTDVFQVTPFKWEKNIIGSYPMDSTKKWIRTDSLLKPIEFGISVRGKYTSKKMKGQSTKLMAIQSRKKKMEDFLSVDTDAKGRFWVTGFQFYDSADIGFKVDNGKKPSGKFELISREIPRATTLMSDSVLKVKRRGKNQYPEFTFDWEKNATILKEVVVEAPRIKEKPIDPIYGTPDISIPSEDITRYNKIYDALLLRVPGLGAYGGLSNRGAPPLLIMDGTILSVASPNGLKTFTTFVDALNDISPFQVERIDVFKFGGGAFYGVSGANGVVIIHTKTAEYKPKPLDGTIEQDSFQLFNVKGYSPTSAFVSPDYGTKEVSTQDDYRSTILWQPNLKMVEGEGKAALRFYTADLPGRYRIVVEGVTTDFKPVRSVMFIDVDDSVK